ncbi:MAG: TlpA disulfide reductase family protein [Planctomycetia bacterium]|nr:TlpA disulfide reductase family protein [Planctomycetia bacterium]
MKKFLNIFISCFCLVIMGTLNSFLTITHAQETPLSEKVETKQMLVSPLSMPSVIGNKPAKKTETSPFETVQEANLVNLRKREKYLWADSWLFQEIPRLDDTGKILAESEEEKSSFSAEERIKGFLKVEEWYKKAPADLKGKYIFIDFAASWCPVCRREIPILNHWHEKYGDDLVVISIYETGRKEIDVMPGKYQGKDIQYYVGIDTKRRCANALGVYGIPHAVLLEPQFGAVIWEGLPVQPDFELTDKIIDRVLEVGKKLKKEENL